MHERKAMMAERADAFVALPGGFGTTDELFEILTWSQLGMHRKPCAVLNVEGYFDGLLAFLDRAAEEQLLRPENRAMLLVESDPVRLVERFRSYGGRDSVRAPRSERAGSGKLTGCVFQRPI